MKTGDALLPLALVGLLSGTLWHGASMGATADNSSRTPVPTTSKSATPTRPASPSGTADDDIDALDVLGESFGVDLTATGLERSTLRQLKVLRTATTIDDRCRAASVLHAFFSLSIHHGAKGLNEAVKASEATVKWCAEASARPAVSTAQFPPVVADIGVLEAFLTSYFDRDALRMEHSRDEDKLLAQDFDHLDKTPLKLEVLHQAADRQKADVSFLIATLPDPHDSFTGWQFDPMLDAVSQGIAASGYILDRFHFPDSDPEADATSAAARGRVHRMEAGVVLFRRHVSDSAPVRERLVLLIVHENPSAGVHARALANAIRLIALWNGTLPTQRTIRILGPTFSGSAESIAGALDLAFRRGTLKGYEVNLVSGSATNRATRTTLECAVAGRVRVRFRATVQPDDKLLPKIVSYVRQVGWTPPVALLFEANTQYGQGLLGSLNHLLGPSDLIKLPFSMNISRVRATTPPNKPGLDDALGLPSHFRPLSMEDGGNPVDRIPQFSPETTASYVELTLSSMLRTMRTEHVGTVALMATDPRDKLFLAQEIALAFPDVSLFTVESDSLYVHPDYSSYLQGALVASTYPLYSANQRWSYGFQGGSERRQFANGSAIGIYNATLALLNYDSNGDLLNRAADRPRLLEYGLPGQNCAEHCQPPVWISVIGRNNAWPVRAYSVKSTDYVFSPRETAPISFEQAPSRPSPVGTDQVGPLLTFPSPLFYATFILLSCMILAGWIGACTNLRQASTGAHRQPALFEGRDHLRERGCLLVGLMGLFLPAAFFAAVCVARCLLDRTMGTVATAAVACVALVALADLTRRMVARTIADDFATVSSRVPSRPLSKWFVLFSVGLGGWAAVNLLWYVWTRALATPTPTDTVSFVARATDFGSGVSPMLPVLFLCTALALWALTAVMRLRLPAPVLSQPAGYSLIGQAMDGDLLSVAPVWGLIRRSSAALPPALLIVVLSMVVLTCVFLFDPIVKPLVTIEGLEFNRAVSSLVLVVQLMVTAAVLQLLYVWSALRRLLDGMAWHRLAAAWDKLPRTMRPSGLFPRTPKTVELGTLVKHWRTALEKAGHSRAGRELEEAFRRELRSGGDRHWSTSRTWATLLAAAAEPPADRAADQPDADAYDRLVAMSTVLVVRDAIARLGYNVVFVVGGMLLVFCSHALFPFQLHSHLAELSWTYVALAFGAILIVLIQLRRNELLNRLASAESGNWPTWNAAFMLKLALFALVPLLTLFAVQFPEAGGVLLRCLEPVRKILP